MLWLDVRAVDDGPGSGTNLEFDGRERMDVVSVADLIEGTCDQVRVCVSWLSLPLYKSVAARLKSLLARPACRFSLGISIVSGSSVIVFVLL